MLKKQYRLRKNKDFRRVYDKKKSTAAGTVVAYCGENGSDRLRIGFSVSKKIGNAVTRNRCRRLLREAARACLGDIRPGRDYVFIGRHSLANAQLIRIRKDMVNALARLDSWAKSTEKTTGKIKGKPTDRSARSAEGSSERASERAAEKPAL